MVEYLLCGMHSCHYVLHLHCTASALYYICTVLHLQVKALCSRVDTVETKLNKSVMADFRDLLGSSDVRLRPDSLDNLANGCLVVDALGPKVRAQLMDW